MLSGTPGRWLSQLDSSRRVEFGSFENEIVSAASHWDDITVVSVRFGLTIATNAVD